MRKAKDLKHLPGDLAALIVKGRAEAASEIHYSLCKTEVLGLLEHLIPLGK